MKTLMATIALLAATTCSGQLIMEFLEDVVVFYEVETRRGYKWTEIVAGNSAEVGPMVLRIDRPVVLLVVTIDDDKEHYLNFKTDLERGYPVLHRFDRGSFHVSMCQETGEVSWSPFE